MIYGLTKAEYQTTLSSEANTEAYALSLGKQNRALLSFLKNASSYVSSVKDPELETRER